MDDKIDGKAWAEAVKADYNGSPIWTYLADRPVQLGVARALLIAYDAASTVAPAPSGGEEAVLRAASELSIKWRTRGQQVDSDDFFAAIAAVDDAVTGLRSAPDKAAGLVETTEAETPADVQTLLDVVTMFHRHQTKGGHLSKHDTWPYIDKVMDAAITLATALRTGAPATVLEEIERLTENDRAPPYNVLAAIRKIARDNLAALRAVPGPTPPDRLGG